MRILAAVLVCVCISVTTPLPTKSDEETSIHDQPNYPSEVSKIIAINLLKSYIDIDGNQVHSPLGVSSILAVLAEAAAGTTYEEFTNVFAFPNNRAYLRDAYKHLLSRYQNHEYGSEPSFQTWLYIYRNHSARDEFKQLVRENYFVDVKDINRDEYDWSEPNTSLDTQSTTISNSKDVIGFETLKHIKIDDENDRLSNLKNNYGEEVIAKEPSKFDRFVDEKQYVEKPIILEEINQEKAKLEELNAKEKISSQYGEESDRPIIEKKNQNEKSEKDKFVVSREIEIKDEQATINELKVNQSEREDELNIVDNETVQDREKLRKNYEHSSYSNKKMVPIQEVLNSNEPEKISLPLQKLESAIDVASKDVGEIMIALESHISTVRQIYGGRSLFRKDDIASSLSANSVTGRDVGSKTKMLLFNGLYFRGNWANAFFERPNTEEYFFMTSEDAVKTPMMHTSGKFYVADLKHLNARAVCLPYENKKYAMFVVVPNELEGLHSVIKKMKPDDFIYAKTNAEERELHISLPKFQVEETSRSESMLKQLGLQKLFSREEADLSLLSDDLDLHVDEIVQFVNVRVDEGSGSVTGLSASNGQMRNSEAEMDAFEVNRPFLFFVMDCEQDFVVVSGKVYTPEFKEELPITIEVEFDQA
ncbi:serpin B13 [Teleopsis dalmanni]|uniref:serpin B13 n=1 Tax=Teleopsis dalmanni TaxID=139649 RepID=UPI0018CDCFC5|nr:serpin B13 [Teleopsis dalmanni]